jgi:hypothetical protein
MFQSQRVCSAAVHYARRALDVETVSAKEFASEVQVRIRAFLVLRV